MYIFITTEGTEFIEFLRKIIENKKIKKKNTFLISKFYIFLFVLCDLCGFIDFYR